MVEAAVPEAGWYPDPAGSDALRWWDGGAWTVRTSPRPAEPADPQPAEPHPADPQPATSGAPPQTGQRPRNVAALVLSGLVALFAIAGVAEVMSGGAATVHASDPNEVRRAFAGPGTGATGGATGAALATGASGAALGTPTVPGCGGPHVPQARTVVLVLGAQGLPVAPILPAISSGSPPLAGACSAVTFQDARVGSGRAYVYPAAVPPGSGNRIAVGKYLIAFDGASPSPGVAESYVVALSALRT